MKKSKYLETAKQAFVFGLGSLSNKLIGFLLLPLYTSRLSTTDYGILSILGTTSSLIGSILKMGLSTSTFKHYFATDDFSKRRIIVSTALIWLIAINALFALFVSWSSPFLSWILLGDTETSIYINLMVITLVFDVTATIPMAILRSQKRAKAYSVLSVVTFTLGTLLSIYFVAIVERGVLGVLTASLLASFFSSVAGLILCHKSFAWEFSFSTLRSLLHFGIPLIPSALSSFALSQADRYFLRYFSTLSQTGLYSLGFRFGVFINLFVVQPFQMIWLPMAFEMDGRPNAKEYYSRIFTYVLLIATWVALGVSLLGREAIFIMTDPSYHIAYRVIPWIALAYVFYAAYMTVNIGIYLKNKTHWAMWIVGGAALFNIGVNFILIPEWGMMGAGVATLLSYMFLFLVALWVNRRIYPIEYEWGRIAKLSIISAFVLGIGWLVPQSILIAVAIKVLLLISFWGILLAWQFFSSQEIQTFTSSASQILGIRGTEG